MQHKKFDRYEKFIILSTLISFLASFFLIRISGFSASTLVNLQNYIIKSIILQSGTSTLGAVYFIIAPFAFLFLALIFLVLGISLLSYYGYYSDDKKLGKIVGAAAAILAIIIFPSIWGMFFALSVFICCFYAPTLANAYSKELKKWIFFRVGSNTAGKILFIVNILLAFGLFVTVLYSQQAYAASFRNDMISTMRSLAVILPGASQIPSAILDQRIEAAVSSSPLFNSYIIWLPVSTAFSVWVILEFLKSVLLSNISGLFTYLMLKKSKWKAKNKDE